MTRTPYINILYYIVGFYHRTAHYGANDITVSLLHTDDDEAPILQPCVSHVLKKKKLSIQKNKQSCESRWGKKKQRLQTLWLDYSKVLTHIQGKMKRTTIHSKILTDTPLESYAQQPAEVDTTKITVWKLLSS